MNLFSLFRRAANRLQCFGKRRYGYLDRSFCYIPEGKEKLYLILSPDLYRINIVTLAVATPEEALPYAPSYFDMGDEAIHYEAYPLDEGRYLLSAFNSEPVRIRLEELGIEPSSVSRFVLAQEAFKADLLPIALSDGAALALSDGVVVRLPSQYVEAPFQNDLLESLEKLSPCLSSFKASMHKGGVPTKTTLTVTAILSLLIVLNLIVQGIMSYREANRIMDEQEQMKAQLNLPSTQMELDALAATWTKKESEQIKLRKIIAAFGTLPLKSTTLRSTVTLSAPMSGQNSIVLVPGSNPSERNLLLVPGESNTSAPSIGGEYTASLAYENGIVSFKILTPSQERGEELRDIVSKTLKTNTVTLKESTVEGSVQ